MTTNFPLASYLLFLLASLAMMTSAHLPAKSAEMRKPKPEGM
jgi:hypothetical protein